MRDLVIYGVALRVANKYVCWNSHKAIFYLGSKENSEIFNDHSIMHFIFNIEKEQNRLTKQTFNALSLFPTAERIYITKDNS